MAKSVVYTCDAETEPNQHAATLQVSTHSREDTTVYTVTVRHTCAMHLGPIVDLAYGYRTDDVSNFNRKAAANKNKSGSSSKGNTKFEDIRIHDIPADER